MATTLRFVASGPRLLGRTRALAGLLLACDGGQKLFFCLMGGVPSGGAAAVVWTAGALELVGGLLIARVGALAFP